MEHHVTILVIFGFPGAGITDVQGVQLASRVDCSCMTCLEGQIPPVSSRFGGSLFWKIFYLRWPSRTYHL